MRAWVAVFGVWLASAYAENINSYQPLQPSRSNYLQRVSGGPLFYVSFADGNLVPEIGTDSKTYSRASSLTYSDAVNTLAVVTSGNPAIEAFDFDTSTTEGGIYIQGDRENLILQSEDIATTWVTHGSGSFTVNQAVAPDGTTTADLMEGDNGSGKKQTSALTAASADVVCSAYARSVSGTANINAVATNSAATVETTSVAYAVGTTWERIFVYRQFTGAAGGSVMCQFTQDTTADDWYLWGAQLEQVDDLGANTHGSNRQLPAAYIPTTTATATSENDALIYTASEIGTIQNSYTVSMWYNSDYEGLTSGSLVALWSEMGGNNAPAFYMRNTAGTLKYALVPDEDNSCLVEWNKADLAGGQWHHVVVTVDAVDDSYALYVDGVSEGAADTNTCSGGFASPWPSSFGVGGITGSTTAANHLDGIISKVRLYDVAVSQATVTYLYNTDRGGFGL